MDGTGMVRCRQVADPEIVEATDAIVQVHVSAVCGSDLHLLTGAFGEFPPDYPIGHEYAGVVVETGSDVSSIRRGDRVGGSFFAACGRCRACLRQDYTQCRHVQLFGLGPRFGALPGTQAEFVRVPFADTTLIPLPDDVTDEEAIFLGDTLSTAAFGVRRAGIRPGDSVAVVGAGPVGLLAIQYALASGAALVIALDRIQNRLDRARAAGAEALPADDLAVKKVRAMTEGEGPAAVVEAVGTDASLRLAFQIVRGFGTVSSLGVFENPDIPIPMGRAFARDLTFRSGMANVQAEWPHVLQMVRRGRLKPLPLVTHRLPLAEAPEGYALFQDRKALKVLLSTE